MDDTVGIMSHTTTPQTTALLGNLFALESDLADMRTNRQAATLSDDFLQDALGDVQGLSHAMPTAALVAHLDTLLELVGSFLYLSRRSTGTSRDAYLHSAAITTAKARTLVSLNR